MHLGIGNWFKSWSYVHIFDYYATIHSGVDVFYWDRKLLWTTIHTKADNEKISTVQSQLSFKICIDYRKKIWNYENTKMLLVVFTLVKFQAIFIFFF